MAAGIAAIGVYIRAAVTLRFGPMLLVLLPLALVLLFFVWKLIPFLVNSLKLRGILGEEAALSKARAISGEDGTVVETARLQYGIPGPTIRANLARRNLGVTSPTRQFIRRDGDRRSAPDRPLLS